MFYIYCYTNKINNKKYIGQTNNVKRRQNEHRNDAFNPKSKEYNNLFHKKMRQYGENNFLFEIIEEIETEDRAYIDQREQYWIKELNSFVKNNQGYNISEGGQTEGMKNSYERSILTKDQVENTKELLLTTELTQAEIGKKFGVRQTYISKINVGDKFFDPKFSYPLRPDKRQVDHTLVDLYVINNMNTETNQQMADHCNVSISTIKRIKSKIRANIN